MERAGKDKYLTALMQTAKSRNAISALFQAALQMPLNSKRAEHASQPLLPGRQKISGTKQEPRASRYAFKNTLAGAGALQMPLNGNRVEHAAQPGDCQLPE